MSPKHAQMALRQASLTEVLPLLAYVEGYAITVSGSGVRFVVREVVNDVVRDVLYGGRPWQPGVRTFPAHLLAVARDIMAEGLRAEAKTRTAATAPINDVRMSAVQVGSLAGVAELAHWAGESMEFIRMGDLAVLQEAVKICDDLRQRLSKIIDPSAEITPARAITHPLSVPIVQPSAARGSAAAPVAVVDTFPGSPQAPRMVARDGDATPKGRR